MPRASYKSIYTGTFISTPSLDSLRVLENHAIGVDENGVIRHVAPLPPLNSEDEDPLISVCHVARSWGWGMRPCGDGDGEREWTWVEGGNGRSSWWFPGFIGKSDRK